MESELDSLTVGFYEGRIEGMKRRFWLILWFLKSVEQFIKFLLDNQNNRYCLEEKIEKGSWILYLMEMLVTLF